MSIELITPTGDRPEQLCTVIECINKQTVCPDRWTLVDDGIHPIPDELLTDIHCPISLIRLDHLKTNSLKRNMEVLLSNSSCDIISVIEDDDYYPPGYLATVLKYADINCMFGQDTRRFYNLQGYYKENRKWTCLHGTSFGKGVKNNILEVIKNLEDGDPGIDANIWSSRNNIPRKTCNYGNNAVVHLTGWSIGRTGTTRDHRTLSGYTRDMYHDKIKQWLQQDYHRYVDYIK